MSGPGGPKSKRENLSQKKAQQKDSKIQHTINARQKRDSKGKKVSGTTDKSGRIVKNNRRAGIIDPLQGVLSAFGRAAVIAILERQAQGRQKTRFVIDNQDF